MTAWMNLVEGHIPLKPLTTPAVSTKARQHGRWRRRNRRHSAAALRPRLEGLEAIRLLSTYVVNSSDTSGTNDPTEMTLYDALFYANQVRGGTIDFDIVAGTKFTDPNDSSNTWTNGSGPYDVTPINENVVTGPITINGGSQPGSQPGQPQIYLDGAVSNFSSNLLIDGGSSTIEGLGFINGVVLGLRDSGGDTVKDCVFGIGPNGQANDNGYDIIIMSSNNTIGGTAASAGNTIAGSTSDTFDGVDIDGSSATGNVVEGNRIGTNVAGTAAFPNQDGVLLEQGAAENTIGGTVSGAGNLISGNSADGVLITGTGTNKNVVEGNLIGTDVSGTLALGNSGDGVLVASGAQENTVGGSNSPVAAAS